jgi:hypothetical protein
MKKCSDCRYAMEHDWGYSNYTVEGTEIVCLLDLNPQFPVDRFYGEEPALNFAETCSKFSEGGAVGVDCDQELGALENYTDDEEIKQILKDY